jgi:hypothetical protein
MKRREQEISGEEAEKNGVAHHFFPLPLQKSLVLFSSFPISFPNKICYCKERQYLE